MPFSNCELSLTCVTRLSLRSPDMGHEYTGTLACLPFHVYVCITSPVSRSHILISTPSSIWIFCLSFLAPRKHLTRLHFHARLLHPHRICIALVLLLTPAHRPGDYLKPGEDEIDGLKRRLDERLAPPRDSQQFSVAHGIDNEWEIGDCLAQWWRPNFETFMVPFFSPFYSPIISRSS
jgi:hypothetical protein